VSASAAIRTEVLDLDGGVTLVMEDRAAGSPIVLLHGFTGDASTMNALAEPLAAGADGDSGHRVIVPNLIGHGGSTGPDPERYSVDAIVDQLIQALDRLEPGRPVDVVGYSMGGRVALTLACRLPERVRSLSLIGASAGLADGADRMSRMADDEALAASIETDGMEAFVDRWMANPLFATQARLGADRLVEFRSQRLRNDGAELARSLRAAGTGRMRPLHDDLASCPTPTVLIVGDEDSKFSAIAGELAARMPNCRVATVSGAGHAAHLENPDAVVAHIRERISDAAGAPAAVTATSHGIRLLLRAPLTTAHDTTTARDSILYSRSADGLTGWGEASPLPGWSVESLDACRRVLEGRPGPETLAGLTGVPAARAAVAGAMFDLDARRHGRLLRDHLTDRFTAGAGAIEVVEVSAVVSAPAPDDVAEEVTRLIAEGFTTIKLKVAAGPLASDVARVEAARAAAPDAVLRIDANGGWDHDGAIEALDRLAPFGVALCEEPVSGIDGIVAVGAASSVPVAVDESARTMADLQRLWSHPGVGMIAAIVIKPQALGGPDLAMTAIADARRAGLDVIVTTMIDSAVGVAHAAHVAAAAGLSGAHGLDTARLLAADVAAVADALPIVRGRLSFAADRGPAERARFGAGLAIGPVSPGAAPSS
jgi:2-succinyl-6-hydroxy-2,4-cyclohexadiene-1-carboxylate synthase/o-succinylbenzoate synthase